MTPTTSRQNVDALLTTRGNRSLTLTPMSNSATASIPFRHLRVLAASLALALAGCATPVLKPSLDMPDRFAAATASADEPEVAWWEGFKDPVLSDLVRRAAQQNRDVKIAAERLRAARAGETISRSWLFPSIGVRRRRLRSPNRLRLGSQELRSGGGEHEGRRRSASA